jgi:hypothetical protein
MVNKSHTRSSLTAAASLTRTYREDTFIQSEIDNEDQDDKNNNRSLPQ